MTVFNLGSINIDTVFQVPHLPQPGETLAATGHLSGLGGKGANQSVAAARAGARAVHIGMAGPDGDAVLSELASYGVEIGQIGRVAGPTGTAMIMVDPDAENSIVILAGANGQQDEAHIAAALETAKRGDTLLLQNETNAQVFAASLAQKKGMRVVYSAAPFNADAVQEILPFVSVLLLNEGEAADLIQATGKTLMACAVPHIVKTMGADGAEHYDTAKGTCQAYPSLRVTPIDTTGAGDTFAGYLGAGLDRGLDWERALSLGLAAAAIATTRAGAARAIPDLTEVEAALVRGSHDPT